MLCPSCGEEVPEKFSFCGVCGAKVAVALPPPEELRKTVTIVFSDLKGSTSLGEKLDPESLREVMSLYFDEMKRALERHGGLVEKFIGDAVMAVFGLPIAHEDDALRAVRAAIDMQDSLVNLNTALEMGWEVTLTNRTGVATGEVVTGDAASRQRLATGDAVNTAARLEQAAPAREILISDVTHRMVKHAVEVEAVEPLALKGKAEPVPAWRLLAVTHFEGVARRLDAPMVGRSRELEALQSAFQRTGDQQSCRLATIFGEAGVGKSRLIAEFVAGLPDDARALSGRCLAYGEGITFWPVADVVKEAAGLGTEDSPEEARLKLGTLCGADGMDVADRVAAAIGLSNASFPLEETFWGVRKLLELLSRERPLVVVFEDVHWAEPTFLDLIEHLRDTASEASLLILCSSRRELLEERPVWGEDRYNTTALELEALSRAESALILDNLIGMSGLSGEVRAKVVEAAEGNPLFVEQMLSMLIDDGHLRRSEQGAWELSGEVASITFPSSIFALVAARLDRLAAEERAVLGRGSVMGQTFYRPAVEELSAEVNRPQVGASLAALEQKELIHQAADTFVDDAYRFHHIAICDTAYQGLLKRTRIELHERFADWLERAAGARAREYEEIIGHHLEQAYRYTSEMGPLTEAALVLGKRAARCLASAGRRAFAREDMTATVNLLQRAVSLLPAHDSERVELLPELAEALREVGEYKRVEAVLAEAMDEAHRRNDRRLEEEALLIRLSARVSFDPEGSGEHVVGEVARAIPVFEETGDQANLAKAWRLLAFVHGTSCRYSAAEEAVLRALDHAKLTGDDRQIKRTIPYLGLAAVYGPMPVAEAIDRCEHILADASGVRMGEALVLSALAHLYGMNGDFEHARDLYTRSRLLYEDIGGCAEAASTSVDSAPVEMMAGDYAAAETELRRDYEALQKLGETYIFSTTAALLAHAVYAQGRYEEAEQLTRVSERASAQDDVDAQVLWRSARAKVLARQERMDEAEGLALEALKLIKETEEPNVQADVLMDLAEVHRLGLRMPDAAEAVAEALELYELKGNRASANHAREALTALAAAR